MGAYRQRLRNAILDEKEFVRAVFAGGKGLPWKRVLIRPVLLQGRRHLQVSHFDEKKDITKNYSAAAAAAKVDELLALPFRSIHVQSREEGLQVQITKKGRAIVGRHRTPATPSLEHDRPKEQPLPADRPDPFLQAIGVMTAEGKVRARMRRKFRQINEFLRLIVESGGLDQVKEQPLRLVDCGCGSAHLTFAVYHYVAHALGRPALMVGVDANQELLARGTALAERLGWEGLSFQAARILDYHPAERPGMVLALHACDTATDEALAQAVRWGSPLIYAAPCCHHHLQAQMTGERMPEVFVYEDSWRRTDRTCLPELGIWGHPWAAVGPLPGGLTSGDSTCAHANSLPYARSSTRPSCRGWGNSCRGRPGAMHSSAAK